MSEIDKQAMYGQYQKHCDDRHGLWMKVAHKALDIGEEDENMYVDNSRKGIGLKEIALIGGTLLAGGALMQAPAIIDALSSEPDPAPVVSPTPEPATDMTGKVRIIAGPPRN